MKRKPGQKAEQGDGDAEEDAVSENSSDGEGWKVVVNSSDEEDNGEANGGEDEDDEQQGGKKNTNGYVAVSAVRHSLVPSEVLNPNEPDDVIDEEDKDGNNGDAFERQRKSKSRTGAPEDWKKHTMSFRVSGWAGAFCCCSNGKEEKASCRLIHLLQNSHPPETHLGQQTAGLRASGTSCA